MVLCYSSPNGLRQQVKQLFEIFKIMVQQGKYNRLKMIYKISLPLMLKNMHTQIVNQANKITNK